MRTAAAYPPRLSALRTATAVPRPKMLPMEKAEPTLAMENALPTEPVQHQAPSLSRVNRIT